LGQVAVAETSLAIRVADLKGYRVCATADETDESGNERVIVRYVLPMDA